MELTNKDENASRSGESLEQLGLRLKRWREARVRGQRIPVQLWAAAVDMARQFGVQPVAKGAAQDVMRRTAVSR